MTAPFDLNATILRLQVWGEAATDGVICLLVTLRECLRYPLMELIIYKYLPISDEMSKCNAQFSDDLKTAVDHQKTAYSALKIHWKWMKTNKHLADGGTREVQAPLHDIIKMQFPDLFQPIPFKRSSIKRSKGRRFCYFWGFH